MAQREIIYKKQTFEISYELLNPICETCIVFLHGWGSNKEIMKNSFAKEFENFKQLYIDLPGFGNSSIPQVITTDDYKKIVELLFECLHVKADIIVGHSFGGKVATLLKPKNLVLLSSAGILVPKSFKIKMKIRFFKIFKNIVPKSMYKYFISEDVKGMNQTMYEILKKVVNEDFSQHFSQVNANTFLFWGEKDTATPLWTGQKIHSLIKNSIFKSYDGDHFFFVKYAHNIANEIKSGI